MILVTKMVAFLLCLFLPALSRGDAPEEEGPRPALSPVDVVEAQLGALRHNDEPSPDRGIERTFRYASPANQAATGPVDNFKQIVHSAPYAPLLNAQSDTVEGSQIEGVQARVIVLVVSAAGKPLKFLFLLSKQTVGQYADCWMTDGVVPVEDQETENAVAI